MSVKKELRKILMQKRKNLHNIFFDKLVSELLIDSEIFNNADTILLYASLDDEISTDYLIEQSLGCGKKVALPLCKDLNGNMDFYYINGFDDLKIGSFSVREPDDIKCKILTEFENSICVVPAIAFDKRGYRLGYGKGYYDRFLQKYSSISVGLCYNELIEEELPINSFDMAVNYIITQNSIISVCSEEENNGK